MNYSAIQNKTTNKTDDSEMPRCLNNNSTDLRQHISKNDGTNEENKIVNERSRVTSSYRIMEETVFPVNGNSMALKDIHAQTTDIIEPTSELVINEVLVNVTNELIDNGDSKQSKMTSDNTMTSRVSGNLSLKGLAAERTTTYCMEAGPHAIPELRRIRRRSSSGSSRCLSLVLDANQSETSQQRMTNGSLENMKTSEKSNISNVTSSIQNETSLSRIDLLCDDVILPTELQSEKLHIPRSRSHGIRENSMTRSGKVRTCQNVKSMSDRINPTTDETTIPQSLKPPKTSTTYDTNESDNSSGGSYKQSRSMKPRMKPRHVDSIQPAAVSPSKDIWRNEIPREEEVSRNNDQRFNYPELKHSYNDALDYELLVHQIIPNLRDIAIASDLDGFRKGVLYRSARHFSPNSKVLYKALCEYLGIMTVIDLREIDLSQTATNEVQSRKMIETMYHLSNIPRHIINSPTFNPLGHNLSYQPQTTTDFIPRQTTTDFIPRQTTTDFIQPQTTTDFIPRPAGGRQRRMIHLEKQQVAVGVDPSSSHHTAGDEMECQHEAEDSNMERTGIERGRNKAAVSKQIRGNIHVNNIESTMRHNRNTGSTSPHTTSDYIYELPKHEGRLRSIGTSDQPRLHSVKRRRLYVCDILGASACKKRMYSVVRDSGYLPMFAFYKVADKLTGSSLTPYYFCKHFLNMHGVVRSYVEMLQHCGERISECLKLITFAEKPILFHCSIGKDRTGIISALILRVLGASDEIIAREYSLTDQTGNQMFQAYVKRFIENDSGLASEFCTAQAVFILDTLEFVNQEYGGVCAYLDTIGFTEDWRHCLRCALIE